MIAAWPSAGLGFPTSVANLECMQSKRELLVVMLLRAPSLIDVSSLPVATVSLSKQWDSCSFWCLLWPLTCDTSTTEARRVRHMMMKETKIMHSIVKLFRILIVSSRT